MSPRRRSDRKLGPTLDVEALLADLLARAETGNLPLASDDEWRAWERAWGRTHPGRHFADLEDMPLGIARRAAITYIEVLLPHIPRWVNRTRAERFTEQAWQREHPRPPSASHEEQLAWDRARHAYRVEHREAFDLIEQQGRARVADECEFLIRKYKLEGLVHVAPGRTPDDSPAPSPAERAEPGAQEIP